jgi:AraC-like DNA-binding protein
VDVFAGREVAGRPLEPRIERALAVLRDAPDRHMSAGDLSRAVGLSSSRLAHLFRQHAGLPVRRYLLWLRLADALREIMRGTSLTHAAHTAGFADSAHLTRTFRRMFGLAPSVLVPSARRLTNAGLRHGA